MDAVNPFESRLEKKVEGDVYLMRLPKKKCSQI